MNTDLHAPLGQDRKPARKRRRFSVLTLLLSAFGLAVIGFSAFTMLHSDRLQATKPAEIATKAPNAEASTQPAENSSANTGLPRSDGQSGANVQQMTTDSGSVVTTYSPKTRDGSGPLLISGNQIGQDPRAAAFPNDALLEDSPYGRLPITGPSGLRPMDQYARPRSGTRGTRVAIVVGGLGLSQTGTQRAIQVLPEEITLAFASTGNSLQRWMQDARRGGHEILLQVPMEPFDYPNNDPGPETLLTSQSPAKTVDGLHLAMGKITNYTGVMNYLGGKFMASTSAMEPVLRDVGKRGLLFLDDGSSAQSKTGTIAKALKVPHAFGDVQLDAQVQTDAIFKKLDELERVARRNGSAIGIASAFDESVDAISKWSEEAAMRGIEIVGVSALADDPNKP